MATTAATGRRVGRRDVPFPKPDKALFPDGVTKTDLADHYQYAAPVLLPHLRDRPLMLLRHPDGIEAKGFVQQEIPGHFPDWIQRTTVARQRGGSITHAVANDTATLVYFAGQAIITPHPWLSRADEPDRPDRLVIDLDPATDDFGDVVAAAGALRDVLAELDLPAYLMTTGSRGVHVVVPLRRRQSFDDVRAFGRDLSRLLAGREPDRVTVEQRKANRGDRVYLDVMRNGYGQTSVPPYGVRPRPGAPFATPLDWSELGRPGSQPDRWRVGDLPRRLDECGGDPWSGIGRHAVALTKARHHLEQLLGDGSS